MSKIWMAIAAVAVLGIIAVLVYLNFGEPEAVPPAPTASSVDHPEASATASADVTDADRTLGDPAAPVTMIEYASLTCPHCRDFHLHSYPVLKKGWIDTGKVRFVYRDFPLDQVALRVAGLARCIPRDRYFGFIDLLFESQSAWQSSEDPLAAAGQIARVAGLGKDEIDACFADDQILDKIVENRIAAERKFEIRATPSFVIDGKLYSGALSPEDLKEVLGPPGS